MTDGPHYIVNAPVSGTEYFAPMGYGCIPNASTTITTHVKSWSGPNATGSLVQVTTLTAYIWDQTSSAQDGIFSGNFNTVTCTYSGQNGTDWFKPAGKWSGAQSVGSLEIWISYTGSAFIPTTPTFSPTSGGTGASVTVTGTHFTDATSVTFNGVAVSSFTIVSDTSITTTVPGGATTGPVAVGNASGTGTSATNFTVTGAAASVFAFDGAAWQAITLDSYSGSSEQATTMFVFDGAAWQQVA